MELNGEWVLSDWRSMEGLAEGRLGVAKGVVALEDATVLAMLGLGLVTVEIVGEAATQSGSDCNVSMRLGCGTV